MCLETFACHDAEQGFGDSDTLQPRLHYPHARNLELKQIPIVWLDRKRLLSFQFSAGRTAGVRTRASRLRVSTFVGLRLTHCVRP